MLTISVQQLASLDQQAGTDFIARLADLIRQLRPDAAGSSTPQNIDRFANAILTRARSMGFSTEFEVAVVCATTLLQGSGWLADSAHPLQEIATRSDTAPRLRATQLLFELERLTLPPSRVI